MADTAERPLLPRRHAATFYGSDDSLVSTIGAFLKEGLTAGEPALVIATPDHRSAIQAKLAVTGINVTAAKRDGDLVLLDAEEMMGTFMVNEAPDSQAFERVFGALMRQVQRGRARKPVRAYGEIVNVLWQRGAPDAAIQVEMLWNKLASSFEFSLLCGYAMGNFFKQAERLEEICRLHSHISHVPAGIISPAIH
jgi:hypothetical protein